MKAAAARRKAIKKKSIDEVTVKEIKTKMNMLASDSRRAKLKLIDKDLSLNKLAWENCQLRHQHKQLAKALTILKGMVHEYTEHHLHNFAELMAHGDGEWVLNLRYQKTFSWFVEDKAKVSQFLHKHEKNVHTLKQEPEAKEKIEKVQAQFAADINIVKDFK